jgi:hypothetical protein
MLRTIKLHKSLAESQIRKQTGHSVYGSSYVKMNQLLSIERSYSYGK